ncbi:MAG: insulinase family protein [Silvanigrellales bacterium]|nr:insulinase family protein [Silvanigrellales bacterium]
MKTPFVPKRLLSLLSSTLVCLSAGSQAAQGADGLEVPLTSKRPALHSSPVALPWRDIRWPSLDYGRTPLPGGGALYTLQGGGGRKFRIEAVFEIGAYTLPQAQRPLLTAAMDLILLGGAGKRSFEEIRNHAHRNGIQIDTRLTTIGYLRISVSGLAEDFKVGLDLLEDMLLRPRFDRDALELWKQEQVDAFNALLDGSSSAKQARFLDQESARLVFGPDHYYTQALKRVSVRTIQAIENAQVIDVARKLVNRAGLTLVLSGTFSDADTKALLALGGRLPRKEPVAFTWMPPRPVLPSSDRSLGKSAPLRMTIIRKADMTQCNATLRWYFPNAGRMNEMERTRFALLTEIYSSSGGVVGNDRFSKALRADSGLSYSPRAQFDPEALEPNTNVALWRMNFQSANEKIGDAVVLARKTWDDFSTKGITAAELERARVSRMNMMMAREPTIFDKTDAFLDDLLARSVPHPLGLENSLLRLERETNVAALNEALFRLIGGNAIGSLVIMGNPTKEQVEKMKSAAGAELVRDVSFEELVRNLQQGKG